MTEQQQEEKRYDPNDTTLKFVTRQDDISIYFYYCFLYIRVFVREEENKCIFTWHRLQIFFFFFCDSTFTQRQ